MAAGALVSSSARATDLPPSAPPPLPVKAAPLYSPAPVATWQGFYVGLNAGWGWSTATQNSITVPGAVYNFSQGGTVLGVTAGYNFQAGSIVFGIEGDIASALINDTGAFCPTFCDTSLTALATLRPRIGFAFGNWMPYLTGGFAWGNVKAEQAGFTNSQSRSGWTFGGGVEARLSPNWTTKLEYLRVRLNSGGAGVPVYNQSDFNLVRVGFNYQFNGMSPLAPTPVARWSGVYIGINGGYGWAQAGVLPTTAPAAVGFFNFNQNGGTFGGTLGANWQVGSLVYGLEGDWGWSDIKGSGNNPGGVACGATCFTKVQSLATLRPRLGWAFGDTLVYLTAGFAWANINAGEPGFSNSHWQPGKTIGLGAEMKFAPEWSAKAEALMVRLNDSNYVAATPVAVNQRDITLIRAGINYHPQGCFLGIC